MTLRAIALFVFGGVADMEDEPFLLPELLSATNGQGWPYDAGRYSFGTAFAWHFMKELEGLLVHESIVTAREETKWVKWRQTRLPMSWPTY